MKIPENKTFDFLERVIKEFRKTYVWEDLETEWNQVVLVNQDKDPFLYDLRHNSNVSKLAEYVISSVFYFFIPEQEHLDESITDYKKKK